MALELDHLDLQVAQLAPVAMIARIIIHCARSDFDKMSLLDSFFARVASEDQL